MQSHGSMFHRSRSSCSSDVLDDEIVLELRGRSGSSSSCRPVHMSTLEASDSSEPSDDEFFDCVGEPQFQSLDLGCHGNMLESQAGTGLDTWDFNGLDSDFTCDAVDVEAGEGLGDGLVWNQNPKNPKTDVCQKRCTGSPVKAVAQHDMSQGLHGVEGSVHVSSESCFDGEDDMERPADGAGAAEQGVDELEPDATGVELYNHVAQGHQPYLSSCLSCVRACGRAPARRLKHAHGPSAIGADFTFMGSLKILVIVVFCTGFLSAFSMDPLNSEANARSVTKALREGGLTGRHAELNSDGEATLLALFRTATRLDTSPLTGLSYSTFAPERSQANGRVERANQTVKELTAANLFFLEAQIGRRIPLESPLVGFAIDYACKTHNAFHLKQGSRATVLDRIRGRLNILLVRAHFHSDV